MRLIFMGTPDFAVTTLQALAASEHEVVLVVTQPDKPRGRSGKPQGSPVKECARTLDIEVYQPKRIREPECVEFLRKYNADLIVVAAFGQILPKEILDMPVYGCVNVHASLLPRYRGAAPIQWAVINGDAVSGVTMMRMDVGLDTGDIIDQAEVPLDADETGGSLFDKLACAGAGLCLQTLKKLADHTATFTPQDETRASHVTMISKDMGEIDWNRPAVEIERLIRGLNPWPSAFTHTDGKLLKVWRAEAIAASEEYGEAEPGTVTAITKEAIGVKTKEGILLLKEVQLEGKKRMAAADFLRGYPLAVGMRFTAAV